MLPLHVARRYPFEVTPGFVQLRVGAELTPSSASGCALTVLIQELLRRGSFEVPRATDEEKFPKERPERPCGRQQIPIRRADAAGFLGEVGTRDRPSAAYHCTVGWRLVVARRGFGSKPFTSSKASTAFRRRTAFAISVVLASVSRSAAFSGSR